jgi:hypothetical protein
MYIHTIYTQKCINIHNWKNAWRGCRRSWPPLACPHSSPSTGGEYNNVSWWRKNSLMAAMYRHGASCSVKYNPRFVVVATKLLTLIFTVGSNYRPITHNSCWRSVQSFCDKGCAIYLELVSCLFVDTTSFTEKAWIMTPNTYTQVLLDDCISLRVGSSTNILANSRYPGVWISN